MIINNLQIIPFIFFFLFTAMVPTQLQAQIDSTDIAQNRGKPTLHKYDARTLSLAGATVADATRLTAININPASLTFVKHQNLVQLNISQNWNNDMVLGNMTFPIFRNNNHGIAGQVGIHQSGIESPEFIRDNTLERPDISLYQFDLAYAYSLDNVLSFGIQNHFSFAHTQDHQSWTYFPTFGMLYSPSQSISYGVAYRGLGRNVFYRVQNDRTLLESEYQKNSLELGATLKFPVDTDQNYLALSLANEKRFEEDGIWYKTGLEVKPASFLLLRGGLLFRPEDEIYAGRFGIGIVTSMLELDYTLSSVDRLYENYHQLGLTIHLNRQ